MARPKEHLRRGFLSTKAVLMFDHNSKLACHVHEHHHHMDFENVEVVAHEAHYHQRLCPISKKYTVNQGCMSLSAHYLD